MMLPSSFTRRRFLTLAGAVALGYTLPRPPLLDAQTADTNSPSASPALPPKIRVGDFTKIYDPSVGESDSWYINDHTFIHAEDGLWHLIGITGKNPVSPSGENFFAHATATDLMGPYTKQPPILQFDPSAGETHVWAPYVFRYDNQYWIYYCGGGPKHEASRIQLATSTDLFEWTRSSDNPMLIDGYDARDPMVLRVDDHWMLYYTANTTPTGGHHTVKAVTGTDLTHWTDPSEVFQSSEVGTYGGPTESPFVVARNGKYYLFVCTNVGYSQSAVYESDSPTHWDEANIVGLFPAHAAEVVLTPDGKWYVSRAGWGQGGVYLAELTWLD